MWQSLGVDDPASLLPLSDVLHLGMKPLLGDLAIRVRLNEVCDDLGMQKQL